MASYYDWVEVDHFPARPVDVLIIWECSTAKEEGGYPPAAEMQSHWPDSLLQARTAVRERASVNERFVLPAWRRYGRGQFYVQAREVLPDAAERGHIVIISGGYGLVRASEYIGDYNFVYRPGLWPAGLLEALLLEEAGRVPAKAVVSFTAAGDQNPYSRLVTRTPWEDVGVTAFRFKIRGAKTNHLARLGQAFAGFWQGDEKRFPPGTIIERRVVL